MGDTNMCTDNPILLSCVKSNPTIICMQRKAAKRIATEDDIIAANKLAFNDDIGIVTNYATGMISRRAGFEPKTKEYETLTYRITCMQNYQQNCIDKTKGVIAKNMPPYWYSIRDIPHDENEELNKRLVAAYKPYFMIYVYPLLRSKLNKYIGSNKQKLLRRFSEYGVKSVDELRALPNKTPEMNQFLDYYDSGIGVGMNACTINRICWLFEDEFSSEAIRQKASTPFDYSILKCNTEYSKTDYEKIKMLYMNYTRERDSYFQKVRSGASDDGLDYTKDDFIRKFKAEAEIICPNEQELCDIVLDLCYRTENSKQFAWDVAGSTIIRNLLKRNGNQISFPEVGGDDFTYGGVGFTMKTLMVENEDDYT